METAVGAAVQYALKWDSRRSYRKTVKKNAAEHFLGLSAKTRERD